MSARAPTVVELVDYFLPLLVTAGDYARQIQPHVPSGDAKHGHNAWVQAVTDADHGVQAFLEIATLARFPDVGFYGEEQADSRHARYFAEDAPTRVWLDPVNGTFLYRNQRDAWDIILSITQGGQLMAAVSYMPARGRFYAALRGLGALTGDREHPSLAGMSPLATRSGSGVCLTYQAPDVKARLGDGFRCFDIVEDYDPARAFDNLNDLFTGRLDAFACRGGDLLDWGAVAFIVSAAGGASCRLDGQPLDIFDDFGLRSADLLVCASPAIRERILARLLAG